MNKKKSILESNVLYTIIAIIAGFLIGAIFLMVAGISPAVAYGKLFSSIFSKPKYLVWTLVYASPLIFTGLSEILKRGRPKAAARFSASTFLPVALGPVSRRCSPHRSADNASSQILVP